MNEKLIELINNFKKDRSILSYDEAATKQIVILQILSHLGWNQYNIDEVYPEYSVGNKKVDYSLRDSGKDKVFIEVKKIGEDLEKHQEQILNYSFQEGIKLAILTNGVSWWFYLPLNEGSWEQRKFYTIELYDQETEDIVKKFEEFLLKENVITDKVIENAIGIYKSRQKQNVIEETLPKAWKKIITEPDGFLVELLSDTTEKLCGYKPDDETVKKFLIEISQLQREPKREIPTPLHAPSNLISPASLENYTGKSIESFTFKGNKYPVYSWKEMLIKLCELMHSIHREQFNKVLNLDGRKKPYFTTNPQKLRTPERINNTKIYVETNFSANSIVKLSKDILEIFGYGKNDLDIEAK